ncbi:uncharacterized protein BXZ73DRAFT_105416 [Epithele typhae]|uniref:uncharacterized protein n=1 Tax=Epithele typhae TaxID=378194 RepID=UPI002007D728|nr:uncharacterized protein BXZ73DRAFT_105416 [Epithele typhae]KAH9917897.1 hypothetical protein BXZ73DRAFT_105416 [Epithele typhae]
MDAHLTLTADRDDGRYALDLSSHQYPTSCSRDEAYVRPDPSRPPPAAYAFSQSSEPSTLSRSHLQYPIRDMTELTPGVLKTGQWTVNHPLVTAYLDALAYRFSHLPSTPTALSPAPSPTPASASLFVPLKSPSRLPSSTSHLSPAGPVEITRRGAQNGGIANVRTLCITLYEHFMRFPTWTALVLIRELGTLTEREMDVIFTLAALRVLNHPTHPAHFALWAKNVMKQTAQVVEATHTLKPCPFASSVSWIGIQDNLWSLNGLHAVYVPPPPQTEKKGGMTLRKRKAAEAKAQVEDDAEEASPPLKRARTTRASQKAKDAAAAQAAEVLPEATEEEEASESLLLSFAPQALPAPALELLTRVKRDLDQGTRGTPMLQAIELAFALDETADRGAAPAAAPSVSAAAASPPTRRSTRARRKPVAPDADALLSAPVSTLSSPTSPMLSPLPAADEKTAGGAHSVRAGSRGSSTAVSDEGYPSEEGTVVDETATPAGMSASAKGKRKMSEMDEDSQLEEPTPGAKKPKGAARKSRAKVLAGSPDGAVPALPHTDDTTAPVSAAVAEEVEPAGKKRKTAATGSKKRATRKA